MNTSYYVNEHTGELCIFTENNEVIATISDCQNMTEEELHTLINNVLKDLDYIQE